MEVSNAEVQFQPGTCRQWREYLKASDEQLLWLDGFFPILIESFRNCEIAVSLRYAVMVSFFPRKGLKLKMKFRKQIRAYL